MIPFPKEDTTPPVIKMYFVVFIQFTSRYKIYINLTIDFKTTQVRLYHYLLPEEIKSMGTFKKFSCFFVSFNLYWYSSMIVMYLFRYRQISIFYFPKKRRISISALSRESEPWIMFSVVVWAKSPRMVPASASSTFVAPIIFRIPSTT